MSKERLAEIIHKEAYLEGTNNLVMVINTDDYKWLIKQAERVQELEDAVESYKKTSRHANISHKMAEEQNKRYREALEKIARINIEQGTVTGSEVHAVLTARKALEGEK